MRHQSIRAYVNQFVAQFSNDFSLEVYLIPSSGLVGDPDGRQNFLICDTHWWKLITGLHLGISASTSSSQTSISCTLLNNTTGLPICWKVIKSWLKLLHLPQRAHRLYADGTWWSDAPRIIVESPTFRPQPTIEPLLSGRDWRWGPRSPWECAVATRIADDRIWHAEWGRLGSMHASESGMA